MSGIGQGIQAAAAPRAVGNYPHARRVGELLFLSGIGPRDPATNDIGMGVDGPEQLQPAYESALAGLRKSKARA